MQSRRWIAVWLGVGFCSACGVAAEHFDQAELGSDHVAAAGEPDAARAAKLDQLAQRAYVKASNTEADEFFGGSVALSADGSTLAVGAYGEDSAATGGQADNSAPRSGAVYVFRRRSTTWSQEAYLKASNTGEGDGFGGSLALSADGATLAVGASGEDSAAAGINGDQADNSAMNTGAVYVFTRRGQTWSQQAYVKASNPGAFNYFGESIALSADGSTLAVGASGENSAATGIDGDQADNSALWSGAVYVFTRRGQTWSQQAYVKASNTDEYDLFGISVALSADGSILAVGAPWEASAATGVGGSQADDSARYAGAAYVFTRSGTAWSQAAYVKASNTRPDNHFGRALALSADGSTLAVGAYSEDSAATGVGGDQADSSAPWSGAVYVLTRSGTTWSQEAYVKASNTDALDFFGLSVALSADGSTLAVSAAHEDSAAAGVGGDQADNSAEYAGAVYVLTRSGTAWSQQAYVKAGNPAPNDYFGESLALSGDGSTLAVGSPYEDGAATGIDGNQADDSAQDAGAVYVFDREGASHAPLDPLAQRAYIKASNTGTFDNFGDNIALSADGSTLAVSANWEDSAATGVGGSQADDSAEDAGAVYVFRRRGKTWVQEAYVKASNTGARDGFGGSLALSGDGATLAVGAGEDSAATGIDGDQADESAPGAGAVYVFRRRGKTWAQEAYVKASNTGAGDGFGGSLALSADGATLAVGAGGEASAATGVGGSQADNSAPLAGAVYVFTRNGTTWSQAAYVKASNADAGDRFGHDVALSADGSILAVGAFYEASAATGVGGSQADDSAPLAGAAYVFARSGTTWSQAAYVKASNTDAGDLFGHDVALSGDGATLAVSAYAEDSAATGIGGNQADDSAEEAGAVYVFSRSGTTWSQQAYVKASNTGTYDLFGASVALSGDGAILAVGAYDEASAATGIDGDQADESAIGAGAVYVFARGGTAWSQEAYVKASNTGEPDHFGHGSALSADGSTMALGAHCEASAATGVGGDQADNSAPYAGAVYVFDRQR